MPARVGERAPEFTLPSSLGGRITLSEVLKDRIAVLAFVHFAFTSG
jgi:peroxiredoxin